MHEQLVDGQRWAQHSASLIVTDSVPSFFSQTPVDHFLQNAAQTRADASRSRRGRHPPLAASFGMQLEHYPEYSRVPFPDVNILISFLTPPTAARRPPQAQRTAPPGWRPPREKTAGLSRSPQTCRSAKVHSWKPRCWPRDAKPRGYVAIRRAWISAHSSILASSPYLTVTGERRAAAPADVCRPAADHRRQWYSPGAGHCTRHGGLRHSSGRRGGPGRQELHRRERCDRRHLAAAARTGNCFACRCLHPYRLLPVSHDSPR